MNRIFKIVIFLCTIALMLLAGNFVFAEGKGYFLEKGEEFFVFDNLYIRGFLSSGKKIVNQDAKNGDVLVENEFILDEDSSFTFCRDRKQIKSPFAPLNTDCSDKVLVWHADPDVGLEIIDPQFYELITNNIEATDTIKLSAEDDLLLTKNLRVAGCLVNDGTGQCDTRTKGQLKTKSLYLKSFDTLPIDTNLTTLTLSGNNINFAEINLGDDDDVANHSVCWKPGSVPPSTCGNANGDSYRNKNFSYLDSNGNIIDLGFDGRTGSKVCCYLKIN